MNDLKRETDEYLLDVFLDGAPEAAESAFKVMMTRHGPSVMGVCRRVLDRHQDAEDATQLTFVTLVRNAGRIRDRRILRAWLCGVAYRVALRMKAQADRRRAVHSRAGVGLPSGRAEDAAASSELRQILHDEVHRLPENFRALVVHSYLEGRSLKEVARILECPIGTVKGRIWQARAVLRQRLMSRFGRALEVLA